MQGVSGKWGVRDRHTQSTFNDEGLIFNVNISHWGTTGSLNKNPNNNGPLHLVWISNTLSEFTMLMFFPAIYLVVHLFFFLFFF